MIFPLRTAAQKGLFHASLALIYREDLWWWLKHTFSTTVERTLWVIMVKYHHRPWFCQRKPFTKSTSFRFLESWICAKLGKRLRRDVHRGFVATADFSLWRAILRSADFYEVLPTSQRKSVGTTGCPQLALCHYALSKKISNSQVKIPWHLNFTPHPFVLMMPQTQKKPKKSSFQSDSRLQHTGKFFLSRGQPKKKFENWRAKKQQGYFTTSREEVGSECCKILLFHSYEPAHALHASSLHGVNG